MSSYPNRIITKHGVAKELINLLRVRRLKQEKSSLVLIRDYYYLVPWGGAMNGEMRPFIAPEPQVRLPTDRAAYAVRMHLVPEGAERTCRRQCCHHSGCPGGSRCGYPVWVPRSGAVPASMSATVPRLPPVLSRYSVLVLPA
jgi:hypothetical protein